MKEEEEMFVALCGTLPTTSNSVGETRCLYLLFVSKF